MRRRSSCTVRRPSSGLLLLRPLDLWTKRRRFAPRELQAPASDEPAAPTTTPAAHGPGEQPEAPPQGSLLLDMSTLRRPLSRGPDRSTATSGAWRQDSASLHRHRAQHHNAGFNPLTKHMGSIRSIVSVSHAISVSLPPCFEIFELRNPPGQLVQRYIDDNQLRQTSLNGPATHSRRLRASSLCRNNGWNVEGPPSRCCRTRFASVDCTVDSTFISARLMVAGLYVGNGVPATSFLCKRAWPWHDRFLFKLQDWFNPSQFFDGTQEPQSMWTNARTARVVVWTAVVITPDRLSTVVHAGQISSALSSSGEENLPEDGGCEASNEFTTFGYPLGLMFDVPDEQLVDEGVHLFINTLTQDICETPTKDMWHRPLLLAFLPRNSLPFKFLPGHSSIQFSRRYQPDAFIAVGGGSVIDAANTTNLYAPLKLVIAGNHDFTMDIIAAFEAKLAEASQSLDPGVMARKYGTMEASAAYRVPATARTESETNGTQWDGQVMLVLTSSESGTRQSIRISRSPHINQPAGTDGERMGEGSSGEFGWLASSQLCVKDAAFVTPAQRRTKIGRQIVTVPKAPQIYCRRFNVHAGLEPCLQHTQHARGVCDFLQILARGQLHWIGATTLAEYRKYIETTCRLRRPPPLSVTSPPRGLVTTSNILKGQSPWRERRGRYPKKPLGQWCRFQPGRKNTLPAESSSDPNPR
ncbi:hypothetical protein AYO20_11588 [Fonsecaea nubica]|uniref:Uncharacterized protein n=1 Tax=Fonsecaea nubica TaxID=856822 RepID=A0A178BRB7_9EURO|nr:hypothetical protein AYO20_11588 [Fonsecaea nubica]OAL19734.1 hypothetical protein AYO20_11588 [Fonsecaea nubica]